MGVQNLLMFRKCNLLMKPLMGKEFLRKMHWLGKIADILWVGRIWRQKILANFSTHEMQSVEFSEILHFHAKSSKWVNIYGEPSNNGLKIMVFNLLFTIAIYYLEDRNREEKQIGHIMMYILLAGINCIWYLIELDRAQIESVNFNCWVFGFRVPQ